MPGAVVLPPSPTRVMRGGASQHARPASGASDIFHAYPHLVSKVASALQRNVLVEQLSRAAERRGKCKTLPWKTAFFAAENRGP